MTAFMASGSAASVASVASSDDGSDYSSGLPAAARVRKDTGVRVAVRIRPLLPKEIAMNTTVCVEPQDDHVVQLTTSQKRFTFDHVFPLAASQKGLYEEALQPLMDSFIQGFNVTVIAYGQTGSGKTYTMGNGNPSTSMMSARLFAQKKELKDPSAEVEQLQDGEGLIPRFLHHLFARLNEMDVASSSPQVTVSFIEIYGEEIHDLLDNSKMNQDAPEKLHLREGKAGVYVQGLTEVKVKSRQEAMEQMRLGALHRITGSTDMNEHSSRSHAVYTVKIVQRVNRRESLGGAASSSGPTLKRPSSSRHFSFDDSRSDSSLSDGGGNDVTIVSKLTFVDLAGSERLKKTQTEGTRMKEGIQINVGLLALGNVINALGDEKRRSTQHHVPYRSSKLTRLLQDALGGNSRTLFIACVSPADTNANEILNTLQYANRAKNIQNKAVKNIDSRSAEVIGLKAFNNVLCRELIRSRFLSSLDVDPSQLDTMIANMLKDRAVVAYLKNLERIATSSSACVDDYGAATEREKFLMSSVHAHISSIGSSSNGYESTGSLTSDYVPRRRDLYDSDDIDALSDGDSSVALMEDQIDEDQEDNTRYSLAQLMRTLDIVTALLENEEMRKHFGNQVASTQAKKVELDARIHRKELIIYPLDESVKKMSEWLSAYASEPNPNGHSDQDRNTWSNVKRQMEAATKKLATMKQDVATLAKERYGFEHKLEQLSSKYQKEVNAKDDHIQQLRQSRNQIVTTQPSNPLDIIIRTKEIKRRFGVRELVEVADTLEQDEREIVLYLDEETQAIAHLPSLFTKNELAASMSSDDVFLRIKQELQNALDQEDMEASLSKELRRRTQIVQSIMRGWLATKSENQHCAMTEQEIISENEQQLKQCEENILHISSALRVRDHRGKHLLQIVESVGSLDMAKSVMKRLMEEIYGQNRLYTAFLDDGSEIGEPEREGVSQPTSELPSISPRHRDNNCSNDKFSTSSCSVTLRQFYEQQKEEMIESHERELMNTIAILTTLPTEQTEAQLALLTQRYAVANDAFSHSSEKENYKAQLAAKDKELSQAYSQVAQWQAKVKDSELKVETFQMMDKCQQIWRELGFNEEYQADKFNDIHALVLKKCSEELEGLEEARSIIKARIDETYHVVKQLESILAVDEPVDLHLLHDVAGTTLLEQEKYLKAVQKKLEDELWQRCQARLHGLQTIGDLLESLEISGHEDFRHVSKEELGLMEISRLKATIDQAQSLKEYNQGSSSLTSILIFFENSTMPPISTDCLKQDELFLGALLKEKSKRIAELEELLSSIRSLIHEMNLSEEDIFKVLAKTERSAQDDVNCDISDDNVLDLVHWVLQKGGRVNVSRKGLESLCTLRDSLAEVYDGRSNAVSFLYSTLEEARTLMQNPLINSVLVNLSPMNQQLGLNQVPDVAVTKDYGCVHQALVVGKRNLNELSGPIARSLRVLLFSMQDDFAAFGIESDAQRVSFFLGRDDEAECSKRTTIERYISGVFSSEDDILTSEPDIQNSFLSDLDPSFAEFGIVYSANYGTQQLNRLKAVISEVAVVTDTVQSAQKRLESLQKIMKLFNEVTEFKKKIGMFEANASKKDRLFGNSLRLLEEERFRKSAAKRYPILLAALRKEVAKWLQNEEGEFDLSILGNDLKNLLLDMMNTDTGLMHLDLGVVESARPSVRRSSKSSLTPSNSSTSLTSVSSNGSGNSSAPARSRSMSGFSRESSAKKRLNFDH